MPKTSKVKKKVTKAKTKTVTKAKPKTISKPKEISKGPIKISKTYIPKETEKYMCEKHKVRMKLQEWKKDLVRANNEALYITAVWMIIVFQPILSIKQVHTQIKMLK